LEIGDVAEIGTPFLLNSFAASNAQILVTSAEGARSKYIIGSINGFPNSSTGTTVPEVPQTLIWMLFGETFAKASFGEMRLNASIQVEIVWFASLIFLKKIETPLLSNMETLKADVPRSRAIRRDGSISRSPTTCILIYANIKCLLLFYRCKIIYVSIYYINTYKYILKREKIYIKHKLIYLNYIYIFGGIYFNG